MSLSRSIVTLTLLAGCAGEASPEPPASHQQATEARPMPPLRVTLEGPLAPQTGGVIELSVRLARSPGFTAPARISLRLPVGVEAIGDGKGARTNVLEADVEQVVYQLSLDEVPLDDVIVTVDARSSAAGVHQELRYRFGRTASVLVPPALRQTALRVGSRTWGPSVDVESTR